LICTLSSFYLSFRLSSKDPCLRPRQEARHQTEPTQGNITYTTQHKTNTNKNKQKHNKTKQNKITQHNTKQHNTTQHKTK
jgi:hypothetical protein